VERGRDVKIWSDVIAYEGVPTLDGRVIAPGAFKLPMTADELPVPILTRDRGSSSREYRTLGAVDFVWRVRNDIWARGTLDAGKEQYLELSSLGRWQLPCGVEVDVTGTDVGVTAITQARLRAVVTYPGYQPAWDGIALHPRDDDEPWVGDLRL
jgi:hypothetical protein